MAPTAEQSAGVATLADIEAVERVPLAERDLPASTYEMLRRGAALDPEKAALRFFLQGTAFDRDFSYSFEELMAAITQAANLFYSLGVRRDDVVSFVLPNLPETHLTIWGGEAAGIVNPINPLLEPDVIAELMNAVGTRVLVTLAPFPKTDLWQKIDAVRRRVPTLETILRVDLTRYLPPLQRALVRAWALLRRDGRDAPGQRIADFNALLARQPSDRLLGGREIHPDDVASIFHTGGTTGTPKLAPRTHRNEVFDAWAASVHSGIGRDMTGYCGLPLFHTNAVIVTGLLPWCRGASVVLGTPQGFRGEGIFPNFWKIVEHYGVSYFSGVPTVYSVLLDTPVGGSDVSSLSFGVCGAAPMPVEVFRAFEERTGLHIIEGYGLTEGTCVSSINPRRGERRVGSIGLRLPYQQMKAVQLSASGGYERDCRTDEIGTIVIRGPNVFAGYEEEVHNEGLWVDAGDGGASWLNTGDMGRQDAEGYFWITGRRKDLIIRGGHNIDPQVVEAALHRHPAVALAASVGRPDARVGEVPVAYVKLLPGAAATADDLLAFARDEIGERAAVPKEVHVVDDLPQTAVGKIFKPDLRRREVARVYHEAVAALPGVAGVAVEAVADRQHGTLARVRVTPAAAADPALLRRQVEEVLARFATRYEVDVA